MWYAEGRPKKGEIMRKLAIILSVLAVPALAEEVWDYDYCDDLWFQRNQIYDNAGSCFKSPLGQAMFDNSDCVEGEVALSAFDSAMVAAIRDEETAIGCAVDSSDPTPLKILDIEARRDTPYFGGEMSYSGCIGYTGEPFPLYAEPSAEADVGIVVMPGSDLSVLVEDPTGDWFYYNIFDDGGLVGEGWADRDIDWDLCTSNAG